MFAALSLTNNNGTEKWIDSVAGAPSWGFSEVNSRLVSQGPSSFTLSKPGDPTADPEMDYGTLCVIRRYADTTHALDGSGTIIFQGAIRDFDAIATPEGDHVVYIILDPWWDLMRVTFQHTWLINAGSGLASKYFCRVQLFQDISAGPTVAWGYLTTGQQISEVITFATASGPGPAANLQAGTIDPTWNMPFYPAQGINCAEALMICLRAFPDCRTWFDYSFTPPKLHIRTRANLTAVSFPWGGTDAHGRKHKSTRIKPLYELQVNHVVIQYQQINSISGQNFTLISYDVYPPGTTGLEMGAIVAPVDLRGYAEKDVNGYITSVAFDPTTDAFWLKHKKDLSNPDGTIKSTISPNVPSGGGTRLVKNTAVNDGSSECITVTDESGSNVDLSVFQYEVTGGAAAAWMRLSGGSAVQVVTANVQATLGYDTLHPKNTNVKTESKNGQRVNTRVLLTNSPTGTQTYRAMSQYTPGDPNISGLAQAIYNSNHTLQFSGTHTIVEDSVYTPVVTPGNVINLTGGNAAWATMNALISSVETDWFHGKTVITLGPEKHLGAAELKERLVVWQFRKILDNPASRSTGLAY